jgi:hypothetical protein
VDWSHVAYDQKDGKGGIEDITFPAVTARYVRMYGTQRNTAYGYSLFEFQIYNQPVVPAITTQPSSVTVTSGETATFTVAASGAGPLSYQWLRNGAPVATTTTPSYTTPATTASDSGALYSVVVSNAAGGVPSEPATLTVTAAASGGAGSAGGTGSNGGTGGAGGGSTSSNLALGMNTTASGSQDAGYAPANAVDGNAGSRWSSDFNDNAWMTVDLGQPKAFDRIVLRWENAYGKSYLIQTSNDNATWSNIATQSAGQGGSEEIDVPLTTARYVRMQGVQRATPYGYSLFEFEIYNSAVTPKFSITASAGANGTISPAGQVGVPQGSSQTFTAVPAAGYAVGSVIVDGQPVGLQPSYTFTDVEAAHSISVSFVPQAASVNLALNRKATSSGDENGNTPPSAAVDGNQNTRWSSAFVDNAWITIDLGSEQTFNRVMLRWENAHAKAYQIQVSHDNVDWSNTVYTQNASNGGVEDVSFASTTARYVRMQGVQRSSPYGYSLFEFEVYNNASATQPQAAIVEQPATQTVPAGQDGHFAVLMSGSGPFSYQWLRAGTPVAGATARTFDTPATTAADNNTVYSVNVTGPSGTVTSNNATLSVNTAVPKYTVKPGVIGVDFVNNTNGAYTDDQVYVAVIARDPATGQFAWLKPDGTIMPASASDNDAPNHLSSGGQNYSNYFFTLAQSKTLQLPPLFSGRVYVSLGSPLYIRILNDANGIVGYAGPNPQNGTDPNLNINFDWYEFTYNDSGIYINTTQVDEFGFPLTQDIYGKNGTWHQQTGITQHRADLFAAYANEVSAAFQPVPRTNYRIMAPAKSSFAAGQPNANYFDAYVNQVWSYYTSNDLVVTVGARKFVGRVQNDQLVFAEVNQNNGAYVGGGLYNVGKPTTQAILEGSGALATGNTMELAIEAQICAAFNRHVMEDVTKWSTPSAWYAASPSNEYARFWHDHGVSGLAYGFAYDDVANASSTIYAPNPEHIVMGIGW